MMISALRLLKIWIRGGIPTLEKYERKHTETASWKEVCAVDFREPGTQLDTAVWSLNKRKAALEGLYGQYEQMDVPLPEHVQVQPQGLCLKAAPASVVGIQWNKDYGFVKAPCAYGGAYVSSLQELHYKAGVILLRVHWHRSEDFVLSAALESDKKVPFIEWFTFARYWQMAYHDSHGSKVVRLPRFLLKEGRSYIFELNWNSKEIRWKVNGMEILRKRKKMPSHLYFSASIGLLKSMQNGPTGQFFIESFRVIEKIRKSNVKR